MDKKNTLLDQAICPGCAGLHSRTDLAGILRDHGYYCCPWCDYECPEPPFRPATVHELLACRKLSGAAYNDVALERYARTLVRLIVGSMAS